MTWAPVINPGSENWFIDKPENEATRGLQIERWSFEEVVKRSCTSATINYNGICYHLRAGVHNITAYDWSCYLDFADQLL